MPQPPQQWTFYPLFHPIFPSIIDNNATDAAIVVCAVTLLAVIDHFSSIATGIIVLTIILAWMIWLFRRKWAVWQWYRQHDEYIRLGDTVLHFCIYPQSGSLHYADIVQVIHWYEERTGKDEHVYDKNIGIIITTRQQRTVRLNLERMVQEDDGISFGENSGIVIRALEEKMKWRRPAGRVRP